MSSNAIDALKAEYDRVQMVMFTRGMPLKEKNIKLRMSRSVYLIKVVFISVLESTFSRSEALYVRHYTKNLASEYQPLKFEATDKRIVILQLIVAVGIVIGLVRGQFIFQYYPVIKGDFHYETLALVMASLTSILFGIKEKSKNEHLSFN